MTAPTSATETTDEGFPVASPAMVRAQAVRLMRRKPRLLVSAVMWFTLATVCGLFVPALLGNLVESLQQGSTVDRVDTTVAIIAGFLIAQAVLIRVGRLLAARFGEGLLADVREEFMGRVLALPLTTVERTGTGDLLTRTSRDVEALSRAVRLGVPSILVAGMTVVLTLVALVVVSPVMVIPCLLVTPMLVLPVRWYLKRARPAYLAEAGSYSDITAGLVETVSGAKTVEALRLAERRDRRAETDIARSNSAERRTLYLRSIWYPLMDFGYMLPVFATLLIGGLFYSWGWVGLAGVTAAALYTRALTDPLDELLTWLNELQVGGASFARLVGVGQAAEDTLAAGAGPVESGRVVVDGVDYAYRKGRNAVDGVSLSVREGERVAIVGSSGAGKSTLGRLLAGIYRPASGTIRIGGVALDTLSLADLRSRVALVSQENHVFMGTVRQNVALAEPDANDERLEAALEAVDAMEWVRTLPDGLDTQVGEGGAAVPLPRAQQLALARLIIADPRVLVLDEATSLLDPRDARHLERSLSAVLEGRTVIAIAHRLHTAHDADTVVLMEDGRVVEQGSHDQLLAAEGAYAQLWESWHGRGSKS